MKNIFLSLSAVFILSVSAQAQKNKKTAPAKLNVPENVNASFKGSFATVEKNEWNKTYMGNYVANFINADQLSQSVEYNDAGLIVKTKTTHAPESLPVNVGAVVETKYAGAKVSECIKMEIPGLKPYYKVKIETTNNTKKELFISEEGTVVE